MNTLKFFTLTCLLIGIWIGRAADPLDTWTWRNPLPTGNDLSGIAYGNDRFVAVGEDFDSPYGTILTSTDGVSWVRSNIPNGGFDVTYGNGQFVALGYGVIHASTDGLHWVQRDPGFRLFGNAITYGNGQFVAVGWNQFGQIKILTSADGATWVVRQPPPAPATDNFQGVAFGNEQFVVAGYACNSNACRGAVVLTSSDGVNWKRSLLGTNDLLRGIAYGNGQFVAVGDAGRSDPNTGLIMSSKDGVNWVTAWISQRVLFFGVTYGNGHFVAVGPGTIVTSMDGINWARASETDRWLEAVAYGDGRFVAVGHAGAILESGPIISLAINSNPASRLLSLSLEGPTGLDYTIQSSTDLVSWRDVTNVSNTASSNIILDRLPFTSERQFYRAVSR